VVSVTPRPRLTAGKIIPPYPLDSRLGGPVWTQGLEEKSFSLCRGSNLDRPVVQSDVRHFTTLYRLSYPGSSIQILVTIIFISIPPYRPSVYEPRPNRVLETHYIAASRKYIRNKSNLLLLFSISFYILLYIYVSVFYLAVFKDDNKLKNFYVYI
jgi:hypothetical protein